MSGLTIRPMRADDLDAVVELLSTSLGPAPGGADRRSLFVWKHLEGHFGPSIAFVAEDGEGLLGLRAFMRWEFGGPGGPYDAVRAVDTATHPRAQRRGIFSRLTTTALEACHDEGVSVVFNTPNAKSLPGYLKMGWTQVARWPVSLKVRRPTAMAGAVVRRDLSAGGPAAVPEGPLQPASEGLSDVRLHRHAVGPSGRLVTPRTPEYLWWRYARAPLPYHVWRDDDALVILRVRTRGSLREAVVNEVLARDPRAARRALLRAVRASGATHAAAHFGPDWAATSVLRRAGFLHPPRAGMTFTVRQVSEAGGPGRGWTQPETWSLTLGDLELF